jgi:amino acid adenylation domain-containing protein
MSDFNERIAALTPAQREALLAKLAAQKGGPRGPEIARRTADGPAPLSFPQQRLWLLHQMGARSGAYNIPIALRLEGRLDEQALARALDVVTKRHDVLRTRLELVDGEPRQVVDASVKVTLNTLDLTTGGSAVEARVRAAVADEARAAFDLSIAPLLRATLVRTAVDDAVLVLVAHHTVCDGWSIGILVRELLTCYAAEASGRPVVFEPLSIQYADFAVWQRSVLQGPRVDSDLAYWRERLAVAPTLELPTDRARPAAPTFAGASVTGVLSAGPIAALRSIARSENATLSMAILAAFQAELARYAGQTDIVVGMAVAGRRHPEVEPLVGCFVNTLALRTDLSGNPTFQALVARVRDVALGGYDHQDLPFEALVEHLQPERQLGQNPIFQAVMSMTVAPEADVAGAASGAGLRVTPFEVPISTSRLDLELHVFEMPDALRLELCYATDLFDAPSAERMLARLVCLLESAAAAPSAAIAELAIEDDDDRRTVAERNQTRTEYPRDRTIHQLFADQACRTPDAVAVVDRDCSLTYGEVEQRANRMAAHLRAAGVERESLVAVCLDRSADLIVAILGILKAGAAFVPLDPEYPQARLAAMLDDVKPAALVTDRRLASALPPTAGRLICLDEDAAEIGRQSPVGVDAGVTPDNLAYVMFTSGSTGRAKGVAVPHRAVVRLLFGIDYVDLGPDQTILQLAPVSFDASTFEIWGALLHGGRLVLYPDRVATPAQIGAAIRRHGVTTMWLTSSLFNAVVDERPQALGGLRQLLIGGEALSIAHVRRAHEHLPQVQIINGYGPTESTTFACCYRIPRQLPSGLRSIPIGRPIGNTRAHILDAAMRPVPSGIPGELFIGGDGLARGYVNRAELTAERFIELPGVERQRVYRTGDLARWQPDGTIEFLGRNDDQVKIRGFRIEPGEIEATLAAHDAVASAAVVVRADGAEKRLVAYVVAAAGAVEPSRDELRAYLRDRLPDYMVPTAFVVLDRLPLNANGKIDRERLPAPSSERQTDASFVAPRSDLEQRIAAIWRVALNVPGVGVRDNFFDLGGHSLLLITVHAQLVESLGATAADLSIVDLFQFPTIESLAAHLAGKSAGRREPSPRPVDRRHVASSSRAVAIVGIAGRFPGAETIEAFWNNLRSGVESIRFFTDAELADAGVPGAMIADPAYVKACAVVAEPEMFDAGFFGYTPREAELIDPQHRVFLECAWHALEDAGCDPSRFDGRVGVFAGARMNTYALNLLSNPERIASAGALQSLVSTAGDFLPTRVSYKLNLRGPSVNVQTACSTSLVAVHQACQSLLNGECDMALAGGAAISVPVVAGYLYQEDGIGSPDGHCRTFDAQARGTVSGNGVGVVVLKPLEAALRDGDPIRAVIRGTAINNDGAVKVGFTAPSVEGQAEVVQLAHAAAGVEPATISYVEAHGTATALGDPIEVSALTKAFGANSTPREVCALGSVKSNIGHLDAAAGVAGLIKTVLALEHRELPPSLHFEQQNPRLRLEDGGFVVNDRLREWRSSGNVPLRAGVSSFGIGGTNAHAVVEEAPRRDPGDPSSRQSHLLMLSARTVEALERASAQLAMYLERHAEVDLADVAYTLQIGRKAFEHRRVVRVRTVDDAVAALGGQVRGRSLTGAALPGRATAAFLFPGQGSQFAGMGRDLYQREPLFRDTVDACCAAFGAELGDAVREALAHGTSSDAWKTSVTQAALFAVELGLARLLMNNGIVPAACVGHSVGEYVAACVGGVLSLEDAARLIAVRGGLMDAAPAGAMLAAALDESGARERLTDGAWLAAVNGPTQSVFSGEKSAIAALEARLQRDGIDCRRLQTAGAFHSGLMTAVLEPLTAAARTIRMGRPEIPYVSNVTGRFVTADDLADPTYWSRHVRETVRFADGVERLVDLGANVLIEVGPGRALSSLVAQRDAGTSRTVAIPTLPRSDDGPGEGEPLLEAISRAWIAGVELDWTALYAGERRRKLPLPGYPFARERYWIDARRQPAVATVIDAAPAKRADLATWTYEPAWTQAILAEPPESAALRRWVVFADAAGVADRLMGRFSQGGDDVVRVRPGESFAKTADGFIVGARSAKDHAALLDALSREKRLPTDVLHAWTLDDAVEPAPAGADSFWNLANLARAIRESDLTQPISVRVLSRRAFAVTGDEVLIPNNATLVGLCRVIPQEQPNIRCSMIDIVDDPAHDAAIDALFAACDAVDGEPVVALRGTKLWKQTFEPRPTRPLDSASSPLRRDGVYLLTGGLGRVGLALADYLVRSVGARVVLVGRSAAPQTGEVSTWLAANASRVTIARADVSDAAQLTEAIDGALKRFGPLTGVFHLAGSTKPQFFKSVGEMDEANVREQFASKVVGTRALAKALDGGRSQALEFVVVASSISTILGGLNFAGYAAANAWMESFAAEQDRVGTVRWVSIAWDGWTFGPERAHGQELLAPGRDLGASVDRLAVTAAEGIEVLERTLALKRATTVVVSTAALKGRIDHLSRRAPESASADRATVSSAGPRPALPTEYVAPRNETERAVVAVWEELLGIHPIGADDNFFELGGHSLLAVQLMFRLTRDFNVPLAAHHLFDAATPAGLAAAVAASRAEQEAEAARVAAVMEEVAGLSDEEVERLLAQEGAS